MSTETNQGKLSRWTGQLVSGPVARVFFEYRALHGHMNIEVLFISHRCSLTKVPLMFSFLLSLHVVK